MSTIASSSPTRSDTPEAQSQDSPATLRLRVRTTGSRDGFVEAGHDGAEHHAVDILDVDPGHLLAS